MRKVDLDYLKGKLEKRMGGFVRIADLVNLEEGLEDKKEENMERITKLIKNVEGKIPKGDYVALGS